MFRSNRSSTLRQNSTRLNLECLENREVPTFFTVNTNSDSVVPDHLTLRQAITLANGAGAGVQFINFDLSVSDSVISLKEQLPEITADLYIVGTITAPGADGPPVDNRVTIQRDATQNDFRLFEVGRSGSAILGDLILLNGHSDGSGGAIYSEGKNLTVTGCEVRSNFAEDYGGGIAAFTGSLEIYDSAINGNDALRRGGAVYYAGAQLTIAHTVCGLNTANGGAGICISQPIGVVTSATLNHVEIVGNISSGDGGGIWTDATALLLTGDTYIHSNITTNDGGGIYVFNGKTTFAGVRMAYDQADQGKEIYAVQGATTTLAFNWELGGVDLPQGANILVWGP
jgi:hypothetical protein